MRTAKILRIVKPIFLGETLVDVLPYGFDIKSDREFWQSNRRTVHYLDVVEKEEYHEFP